MKQQTRNRKNRKNITKKNSGLKNPADDDIIQFRTNVSEGETRDSIHYEKGGGLYLRPTNVKKILMEQLDILAKLAHPNSKNDVETICAIVKLFVSTQVEQNHDSL